MLTEVACDKMGPMGYLRLPAEEWLAVLARIRSAKVTINWTWAAYRTQDGTWTVAVLNVRNGNDETPELLEYPDAMFGRESINSAEAADRIASGIVSTEGGAPERIHFPPPAGNAYPHRVTTEPHRAWTSRSGWPEYVVTHNIGPSGHFGHIEHLVAPGMPAFISMQAAIAEFVYRVPAEKLGDDTSARLHIQLADHFGRIDGVVFKRGRVRVTVSGNLSEATLKHGWRATAADAETTRGDSRVHGSGLVEVRTGKRPHEFWALLCDGIGNVSDRRHWSGSSSDEPAETTLTRASVQRLIRSGEGPALEFKQVIEGDASKRSLTRTVAAFANDRGGVVLVGVSDEGDVVGYSPPKAREALMDMIRSRVKPPPPFVVRTIAINKTPVQAIEVRSGPNRPYRASGVVTVRRGASTYEAESEEIREISAPQRNSRIEIGPP